MNEKPINIVFAHPQPFEDKSDWEYSPRDYNNRAARRLRERELKRKNKTKKSNKMNRGHNVHDELPAVDYGQNVTKPKEE